MNVEDNIRHVRETMAEAARRSGRPASAIRLMAVTKTVDDDRILAAIRTGVEIIGENYVQEAKRKIEKLGKSGEWHLIGRLQTNKAKYAVHLFDMIHSVDRLELAAELDRRARAAGRVIPILIEVNVERGGIEERHPARRRPGSGPPGGPLGESLDPGSDDDAPLVRRSRRSQGPISGLSGSYGTRSREKPFPAWRCGNFRWE